MLVRDAIRFWRDGKIVRVLGHEWYFCDLHNRDPQFRDVLVREEKG